MIVLIIKINTSSLHNLITVSKTLLTLKFCFNAVLKNYNFKLNSVGRVDRSVQGLTFALYGLRSSEQTLCHNSVFEISFFFDGKRGLGGGWRPLHRYDCRGLNSIYTAQWRQLFLPGHCRGPLGPGKLGGVLIRIVCTDGGGGRINRICNERHRSNGAPPSRL